MVSPTPCADWTVHELVNHLVAGNLVFESWLTPLGILEARAAGAVLRDAADFVNVGTHVIHH